MGTVLKRSGRFWCQVEDFLGCRLWTGRLDGFGYGRCQMLGEAVAQRVAWRLEKGVAPVGRLVNECGKRHCVDPSHWRDTGEVVVDGAGTTRLAIRRAEIERLWGDGYGVVEIAALVGCARSTVWRHLRGKR